MEDNLKWQTRDEMAKPTNPLQQLTEIFTRSSRDIREDVMLSAMYGIIVGWSDEVYEELQEKHGWPYSTIEYQKKLHKNYKEAWNLYYEHLNKSKNG